MPQERRDRQLAIRIPLRIWNAIMAHADREDRTPSDIINKLLGKHYPPPKRRR